MGSEDLEASVSSTYPLQAQLFDLLSDRQVGRILSQYQEAEDWPSIRMIRDLRDATTDHSWLWMLGPNGPRFTPHEFCLAVRVRIGADVAPPGHLCAVCGESMDTRGIHAMNCAPGESTRGHYSLCSVVHCLASLSDSSACTEVRGLVPSRPALRPADVLTSAAFGHLAALDVCVTSPERSGAGPDACIAGAQRKLDKYAGVLDELVAEGYDYRPLVWSCWGRAGTDAAAAIRTLSAAAARRRGLADDAPLARRARALIGARLWRRVGAMVRVCLQKVSSEDVADLLQDEKDDSYTSGGEVE